MPLARAAIALINPSLFEGWSTTVEEAKSLGVPMLLSGIALHREQAGTRAQYFDPHSEFEAAECLSNAWRDLPAANERLHTELQTLRDYEAKRLIFADKFRQIVASLAA
jgi:glycosyltransferase involved in cell wall biosynthesis